MKDPMMIQHQAYLKDLENVVKTNGRGAEWVNMERFASANGRVKTVFVVFVVIVTLLPWGAIPV